MDMDRSVYILFGEEEICLGCMEEILNPDEDIPAAAGDLFRAVQSVVNEMVFGDEDSEEEIFTIELR